VHPRIKEIIQNTEIEYKVQNHADLGDIRSPADVAVALGYSVARIAKTLLLQAVGDDRFFLVVAPTSTKLDLKQLANLIGARRLQLASKDDLNDRLGYPSHGVSPLGSQGIPVFMDSSLFIYETILVGAGVIGQEIELQPHKLQELTNATLI
jgi:Cys-tRNA(Pro)/Cys-tRNA(Cys) deacylase